MSYDRYKSPMSNEELQEYEKLLDKAEAAEELQNMTYQEVIRMNQLGKQKVKLLKYKAEMKAEFSEV